MEKQAMVFRQLIGQFQDLLLLYDGFSPPPASFPDFHHPNTPLLLQPPFRLQQPPQPRLCFLNLDGSSPEDDCYDLLMGEGAPEKPENFKMLESGMLPLAKKARKDGNQVKFVGITNVVEVMEQEIWKDFPEDLFEAVIARLPVATLFRFRAVCRKWDSLLTSQSFSQQCAQVPQAIPWFYTINHENLNTGAMYNPTLKKWHHPPLPDLPTKSIVLPVASDTGLVCFIDVGHRSFYICNPLTRSLKELPPRSVKVWSRVAVGMTKSTNGGYKLLWVGCDGEYEIYDSKMNSWTRPGNMTSNIKLPLSLNFRSQAVCIDGVLHFMRSDPDGIVSYDMVTGVWTQFIVPDPCHLSDHSLAGCGDRILLVGLVTKNAATCVCIWELQKMTLLWKEVDRMPNMWCLLLYGKHIKMSCLGNNGLLMLSLRSRQMNRLITYDALTREWVKVPTCVLPYGRKRQWIACGTAFEPCPTALP